MSSNLLIPAAVPGHSRTQAPQLSLLGGELLGGRGGSVFFGIAFQLSTQDRHGAVSAFSSNIYPQLGAWGKSGAGETLLNCRILGLSRSTESGSLSRGPGTLHLITLSGASQAQ